MTGSCQGKKSGLWPIRLSSTGLRKTTVRFTATHWTQAPTEPPSCKHTLPGSRKNLQISECSHKQPHCYLTSPPEAEKVGAVFLCQRWGNWPWVSKQGEVGANGELGARRQAADASAFRFTKSIISPEGTVFPSIPSIVRPSPLELSKPMGHPGAIPSFLVCRSLTAESSKGKAWGSHIWVPWILPAT